MDGLALSEGFERQRWKEGRPTILRAMNDDDDHKIKYKIKYYTQTETLTLTHTLKHSTLMITEKRKIEPKTPKYGKSEDNVFDGDGGG